MSKRRCGDTKGSGEPCEAAAGVSGFCFMHDPGREAERRAARRKGGLRSAAPHVADADLVPQSPRTLPDVMRILDYTLRETLALDNGIQRGRLLVAISQGYVETIKTGELEARLEAIERALRLRKEGNR